MLCRKFELIPTEIFQVMAILKSSKFLEKSKDYSPWVFLQKMALKSPPILITIFLLIIVWWE